MTSNKEFEGDIVSRNHEALANVLLAFDNYGDLRNVVIKKAEEMNAQNVTDLVKWAIESVKEIENKKTAFSA